jgi:hypothetical protein
MVDRRVIYEGDDWRHVFFDAMNNPNNGTITHLADGQVIATMGPNVRLYSGMAPFIPPVQSVHMTHLAFQKGYQSGRATIEPHVTSMTDQELVSMLKVVFTPNEEHPTTEDELYWQIGNILGTIDAQTQYTIYKVVSVCEQSRHNEQQCR